MGRCARIFGPGGHGTMPSNQKSRWRLGIGTCAAVLMLIGGGGAMLAYNHLDLERRRNDPARLERVAKIVLPSCTTQGVWTDSISLTQIGDWPQWRGINREGI